VKGPALAAPISHRRSRGRTPATARRLRRTLRLYVANGSVRALGQLASHVTRKMLGRPVPTFVDVALTHMEVGH